MTGSSKALRLAFIPLRLDFVLVWALLDFLGVCLFEVHP